MLHYEELPYRYYMYDDFSPLNKLYPGDPVEVGYRGNMYQIVLDSIRHMDRLNITRYHLALQELKEGGYITIGEGSFDGDCGAYAYPSSLDLIDLMGQIKSAIIQLNVKPTDYYK